MKKININSSDKNTILFFTKNSYIENGKCILCGCDIDNKKTILLEWFKNNNENKKSLVQCCCGNCYSPKPQKNTKYKYLCKHNTDIENFLKDKQIDFEKDEEYSKYGLIKIYDSEDIILGYLSSWIKKEFNKKISILFRTKILQKFFQ